MTEKSLYCCLERYDYEGLEYYGWFDNDKEAIREFRNKINKGIGHTAEWYIGRIEEFDKVIMTLSNKSKKVRIIKTKEDTNFD